MDVPHTTSPGNTGGQDWGGAAPDKPAGGAGSGAQKAGIFDRLNRTMDGSHMRAKRWRRHRSVDWSTG